MKIKLTYVLQSSILRLISTSLCVMSLVSCSDSETQEENTVSNAPETCEGVFIGKINAPIYGIKIANRDRQLAEGGALTSRVDGGIYFEGTFAWETNEQCIVVKSQSTVFGLPVSIRGVVQSDGVFNLTHDKGFINGKVDGTSVGGRITEGVGREWVYGDLVGAFKPYEKL